MAVEENIENIKSEIRQNIKCYPLLNLEPFDLLRPANFERWCSYTKWPLDQAVALLMNREPHQKRLEHLNNDPVFNEIYDCLIKDCHAELVKTVHPPDDTCDDLIKPLDFVEWAENYLNNRAYLPSVINYFEPSFPRCTVDDPRVAQYLANLEKMRAYLSEHQIEIPQSEKNIAEVSENNNTHHEKGENSLDDMTENGNSGQIEESKKAMPTSYGFKWLRDGNTKLNILYRDLVDHGFIGYIPFEKFCNIFCYGESDEKVTWKQTLVLLKYLVDKLKSEKYISTPHINAQASRVFNRLDKEALVPVEINSLEQYKTTIKTSSANDKNNMQIIDNCIKKMK